MAISDTYRSSWITTIRRHRRQIFTSYPQIDGITMVFYSNTIHFAQLKRQRCTICHNSCQNIIKQNYNMQTANSLASSLSQILK